MPWACSRDGHGGTLQGHWHWVGRQHRAAFVRFWVGGGSKRQLVRTGFWRQIGAGARRGAGLRDLAYRVSKLFSQHCVRTCRTAETGPLDRACGSEAFPFLDRFTGEVGVRGAPGPSPPCTSEVVHPSEGERDDGGLAGTLGASAGKPSAPGTYGGLVCPSLAGRESTRRDDVARAARRAVNPERLTRWAARRRPSGGSGWRVELAVGPCWFLAPNG